MSAGTAFGAVAAAGCACVHLVAVGASAVLARAARQKIEMPICAAVDAILHKGADLDEAIRALLARPLRREGK